MKGSDNQEKLVYQIIEDAGNKGGRIHIFSCSIKYFSVGLMKKAFFLYYYNYYCSSLIFECSRVLKVLYSFILHEEIPLKTPSEDILC